MARRKGVPVRRGAKVAKLSGIAEKNKTPEEEVQNQVEVVIDNDLPAMVVGVYVDNKIYVPGSPKSSEDVSIGDQADGAIAGIIARERAEAAKNGADEGVKDTGGVKFDDANNEAATSSQDVSIGDLVDAAIARETVEAVKNGADEGANDTGGVTFDDVINEAARSSQDVSIGDLGDAATARETAEAVKNGAQEEGINDTGGVKVDDGNNEAAPTLAAAEDVIQEVYFDRLIVYVPKNDIIDETPLGEGTLQRSGGFFKLMSVANLLPGTNIQEIDFGFDLNDFETKRAVPKVLVREGLRRKDGYFLCNLFARVRKGCHPPTVKEFVLYLNESLKEYCHSGNQEALTEFWTMQVWGRTYPSNDKYLMRANGVYPKQEDIEDTVEKMIPMGMHKGRAFPDTTPYGAKTPYYRFRVPSITTVNYEKCTLDVNAI